MPGPYTVSLADMIRGSLPQPTTRPQMPQGQPYTPRDPNNPYPLNPSQWDKRADGTQKGNGFLGPLIRPDGTGLSSEISIGVNFGGKDVEIPTMVPTLNRQELLFLMTQDFSKPFKIPESIVTKAVDFARQRAAKGQPFFAKPGEEDTNTFPDFKRAGVAP